MKKLILIFFTVVISGYCAFAQDEEQIATSSRSVFAAYSPSTSALIGFQVGLLPNSDGLSGGTSFIDAGGIFLSGRYNSRDIMNLDRLSVDLGLSLQVVKFAHVFIGGGYGSYKYPYKEPTIQPDKEISGYEVQGGTILSFGKINVHAGVTTLKFEHLDFFGGIGYVF